MENTLNGDVPIVALANGETIDPELDAAMNLVMEDFTLEDAISNSTTENAANANAVNNEIEHPIENIQEQRYTGQENAGLESATERVDREITRKGLRQLRKLHKQGKSVDSNTRASLFKRKTKLMPKDVSLDTLRGTALDTIEEEKKEKVTFEENTEIIPEVTQNTAQASTAKEKRQKFIQKSKLDRKANPYIKGILMTLKKERVYLKNI